MKTERLYYSDPYISRFQARVVACAEGKNGWEVALDRSAFYPEGGGQPGDTGFIGDTRVTDTHEKDGVIVHYCDAPPETGDELCCRIDFDRRFDLMQQHSGEHIVSGIIHRLFGYENVGFHLGTETVTIDFNGEITPEQLLAVEREANGAVWKNLPFIILLPAPEELEKIPYRSKKALTGQVRIVECPGMDICACCGTHVKSAGEIGIIKLLSVQKFREGARIEMLSGARAYEFLRAAAEQNGQSSVMLSAKPLQTAAAVRRLLDELAETKYRLNGTEDKYFALLAEKCPAEGTALMIEDALTADGVRRLACALTEKRDGLCAVFSGSDGEGYKYALGQKDADLRGLVAEMNAALNGRGGGKPFFAQGSAQAARAEIEAFFSGK